MEITTQSREQLLAKWGHLLPKLFDVWTWTSPGELCWLADMAARSDVIAEVGCYHAKSTKMMWLANPSARIVACDLPESERCWKILEANLSDTNVVLFRGKSPEANWAHLKRDGYNFAFIDAGHLEPDVTLDIQTLLPHMAPGSIIAGHDWRHNNPLDGVNVAVEKAFDKHRIRVFESIWHIQL